ncbi:hypothetical protein [Pseudaestuariivita atlantica]|uniref:DUF2147 domain-containing protein n=1 Tax=Pseudaestuariivita atlantica TaxID=1317121 RepID=A0A0L1JRU1_9RHOB|nr:hypothetical protein [Pseudaestuariivita atlantica]KNG94509.1 hypothetical protein ATO11_03560 [Pseudaestuariivita atlantica]
MIRALFISLVLPAAVQAQDTAGAFWDALLGCWAVKDGAPADEQGWTLKRDWTPDCGDCAAATQLWDAGAGLTVARMRETDESEPSCALNERSWPRAAAVLPALEAIWAKAGVSWIADDLKRPAKPFAILLSCEADLAARKVAVVDASGGALRFTVSGWMPDHAEMCAGAAG